MLPGGLGDQYRTRDVIAAELLDDDDDRLRESAVSDERRPDPSAESTDTRIEESGDFDDEEPVTDVEILTGPATPE